MADLTTLFKEYAEKNFVLSNAREIRSGKEATVYRVQHNGTSLALKVYEHTDQRGFQRAEKYLEGKFVKGGSVQRSIVRGNSFAKEFLHTSWIKREFDVLKNLNKHGAAIPAVLEWTPSSILMEFIGDEEPAPRLIDMKIDEEKAQAAFDAIIGSIQLFLKVGIVHSDLSAYNILWWKEKPCIIDFPQAVDIRENPHVNELLKRDIDNVVSYFKKYIQIDVAGLYQKFKIQ